MKKKYLLFMLLFGLFIIPNKVFAYDDYVNLIEITNGYAVFETSHFSVYTLAEKQEIVEESNPPTVDNIKTYIMIGEVSMLMLLLFGCTKIKNKKIER